MVIGQGVTGRAWRPFFAAGLKTQTRSRTRLTDLKIGHYKTLAELDALHYVVEGIVEARVVGLRGNEDEIVEAVGANGCDDPVFFGSPSR